MRWPSVSRRVPRRRLRAMAPRCVLPVAITRAVPQGAAWIESTWRADARLAADRRGTDGDEGLTMLAGPDHRRIQRLAAELRCMAVVVWLADRAFSRSLCRSSSPSRSTSGGSARCSAGCTCAWDRTASVRAGLAQTFADVFKLLLKEYPVPAKSSKLLFLIAPLLVAGSGARGLGGDSVSTRSWCWPTSMPGCCTCWR